MLFCFEHVYIYVREKQSPILFLASHSFPGGSVVKNTPANVGVMVPPLGWEDPLEEEMANQASILAWKIPWRKEPGRIQSMGLPKSRTSLSN